MYEKMKGEEVDIMSTMKPIQATPELNGKDALKLLCQANTTPTERAVKKNNMLRGVLTSIRKA